MKKLIAITLALIFITALINTINIRVAQGEVTSTHYIESADHMDAFLTTTDDEVWIAEGYTAPIGDKVLIIYDIHDKSTIYDDEIKHIIHFTDFE